MVVSVVANDMSSGAVTSGAVVSWTVIIWVSVAVLPDSSVADSNLAGGGDDIYFVLVDGEEVDYKESKTDCARTLTIDFVADSEEIKIIGLFVAAEFDTVEKEEVMPPLKQVQQGALVGQVSYNGDRILMLTPSGQADGHGGRLA